jgi:hypothetical protein
VRSVHHRRDAAHPGSAATDQHINISGGRVGCRHRLCRSDDWSRYLINIRSDHRQSQHRNNNANLGVGVQRWGGSLFPQFHHHRISLSLTLLPSPSIAFGAAGTKTVTNGSFSDFDADACGSHARSRQPIGVKIYRIGPAR